MWKEIRADRIECDVLAEIPPLPNRHHGSKFVEITIVGPDGKFLR